MLYYEIMLDCHQKLTSMHKYRDIVDELSRKSNPKKDLCTYMEEALEKYANEHRGYFLKPSINSVKKSEIQLLVCFKYEFKRGFDLYAYIKKVFKELFKLTVDITSCEELTNDIFFNKVRDFIGHRYYIEYNNDEYISFDFVRHKDDNYEEHLYPEMTREEILAAAQNIMPDVSLLEELQRILDQDKGRFYGIPVHYKITAETREAAQKIVKILVQALACSHRLLGTRTSFLFPCGPHRRMPVHDIQILAKNNYGAVTVVELTEEDDEEDTLFDEGNLTEEIVGALQQFKNYSQMIFVEIAGRQQGVKNCLAAIKKEVRLIELKEGVGDSLEAEQLLKEVVEQSDFGHLVDFESLKKDFFAQPNVSYNISSVYTAWKNYRDEALVSGVYTQYKPMLTTQLKQEEEQENTKSPYAKLNRMIGLSSVKEMAKKVIATFKVQRKRQKLGMNKMSFSRHMLFTGNPGTAKTTVARLLAQIFAKEGITPSPTFVECGRSDLVAKYVGHTAVNVKKMFEKAKGGVLFIDEAYSLVDSHRGSFGDEAINTIVQEMENNRDDTIVIFAGYPQPMQDFLETNEGLCSRIGFHLDFPDYSVDELQQILELMLEEREYTLSEEAKSKSLELFEAAAKQSDFGNGRYVRNVLEQMIMQQSLRIFNDDKTKSWDRESISLLTAADVPSNMLPMKKEQKSKSIGFNCA